mmetsp:Transcript_28519/g.37307  ORF Transcript_28519/g.37307 Transcript_28519/m.37307 type:complete len:89 (-) Transcript_28519:33-299(-)
MLCCAHLRLTARNQIKNLDMHCEEVPFGSFKEQMHSYGKQNKSASHIFLNGSIPLEQDSSSLLHVSFIILSYYVCYCSSSGNEWILVL